MFFYENGDESEEKKMDFFYVRFIQNDSALSI